MSDAKMTERLMEDAIRKIDELRQDLAVLRGRAQGWEAECKRLRKRLVDHGLSDD